VTVTFGFGGAVAGPITAQVLGANTPAAQAGKDRAVRAVYALQPSHVPREMYGEKFSPTFNAREACAQ
jgi:hypothetical protein